MSKVGVLFSNLGTPDAPDTKSVGRYLGEFLMDPHVINSPWLLRWLLVKGVIVPTRSSASAKNYRKIWTEEGSPLLIETENAARALQDHLGQAYKVVVGMRYGQPNFEQAKKKLADCSKVIFFPQYPQYAASSLKTSLEHFEKYFSDMKTQVIPPYYSRADYIKAYGLFLKKHLGPLDYDHILMSFHGLPESHMTDVDPTGEHCLKKPDCCRKAEGDVLKTCYRAQCVQSADLLASELGLSQNQFSLSFQSRLGRQKWIEPYTDQMYAELLNKGFKKLAVVCPGFSVDCLETLEEIAMAGKESFLSQGGEALHYIPCLNDDNYWIKACADIIMSEEKR